MSELDPQNVCYDPRHLPSSASAIELVEGRPGSPALVALHVGMRTLLIAAGLYAFGGDRSQRLWQRSLGASVAIEAFALVWVATHPRPQA